MKHCLFFFIACLANVLSIAQKHELVWSSPRKCDNGGVETSSNIVNANDQYVCIEYISFNQFGRREVKIVAYDKTSLNEVNSLVIEGFKPETVNKQETFADKEFINYTTTSDGFVVLWQVWHKATKKTEFIAESFKLDLNRISELKKITEVEGKIESRNIISRDKAVVFHFSRLDEKNANIQFDFVKMSTDLTIYNNGNIKIPFTKYNKTKRIELNDFYDFSEEGIIIGSINLTQTVVGSSDPKSDFIAVELNIQDNTHFLLEYQSKDETKEWMGFLNIKAHDKSYLVGLYRQIQAASGESTNMPSGFFIAECYADQRGFRRIEHIAFDRESLIDQLQKNSSEELDRGSLRFDVIDVENVENDFIVVLKVMSCPNPESILPIGCERLMYSIARLSLEGDIVWNRAIYTRSNSDYEYRDSFNVSQTESDLFVTFNGVHASNSELFDDLNLVFINLVTGNMKVNEAPVVQVGMPPDEGEVILEDYLSYGNERIYVYKVLNKEPSISIGVLRPLD